MFLYNDSSFSCFLWLEDVFFILFQQRNEIKKENALMELNLHFCSSIDLFDVKDFKGNLTDGNLIGKCV